MTPESTSSCLLCQRLRSTCERCRLTNNRLAGVELLLAAGSVNEAEARVLRAFVLRAPGEARAA